MVAANDQPDSFHKLCALVATFTHNMKARFSTNDCKMAVLGPSDSLHFVDLVIGAIKDDITHPDPDSDPLPRFDIYSPQPTVSQVVLRKLVADQDDLNYLISAHYIKEDQDAIYLGCRTIFRANGNDDELLKALMGELEARGLNITDPTKRIALITEADSVYGKTIPGRFVQLLRQRSLEKAAQAAYGSDPRKNSTEAGLARQLVEKYGPLKDMQARLAEISQDIQNLKDPYPGLFELQKADLALHSWRSSRELLTLIYRELSDPAAMEMRKSQQNQPPPLNEAETRDEQKFNEAQNLLLADEKNLQDTEAQLASGTSQVKTDEGDWSKLEDQWRNDRQKTWKDDGHKKDSSNQLEKDIEAINEERRTWETDSKPLPTDQTQCRNALIKLKKDQDAFDSSTDGWANDVGSFDRKEDIYRDYKALFFEWALLSKAIELYSVGDPEKVEWELAAEAPTFCRQFDSPKDPLALKQAWTSDSKRDNLGSRKIQVFTYLRGVDGQSARGSSSKGDKDATSGDSSAKGDISPAPAFGQELAQGTAQFDYIRRMIDELLDSQKKNNSHFCAIGVTGSDVYDKLIILRALKQQFPAAILFTTDLNAVYLQSTEAPFARNLLIGSHFNLTIAPGPGTLQFCSTVVPFRDSYQTATYYSCLKILNPGNRANSDPPPSGVFEVARDGFYPLSRPDDPRLPNPWAIGLERPGIIIAITIFIFAFCTNLYFVADKANTGRMIIFYVISAAFLSTLLVLIKTLSVSKDQEPFAVFEGISTWPSTIIRAIDLVLVVYFIIRIHDLLKFDFSSVKPLKRAFLAADPVMKKRRAFINPLYSLFEWNSPKLPARSAPATYQKAFEDCRKLIRWKWPFLRLLLAALGFKYPNTTGGMPTEEAYEQAMRDFRKQSPLRKTLLYEALTYNGFKFPIKKSNRLTLRVLQYTFRDFSRKGLWRRRAARVGIVLFWFALFAYIVMIVLGMPVDPTRGAASRYLVLFILFLAVTSVITLTFVVADALALSQSMIVWLEDRILDVKEHFAKTNRAQDILAKKDVIREFLDFSADHTKAVTSIIYFPFIAILLLLFARDSLFAHYDWPPSLCIVIAAPFCALAWAMYCLQRDAQRMRQSAIDTLTDDLRKLDSDKVNKKKVKDEIKWMMNLDEGAFANLTKAPFIRALLIPLGGVGSLQLIEYLRQFFGG